MTKRKVGTLHFSVEGLFVVNIAREEAVYGSWKNAINMLIDSFHGMNNDHAIALLKGDKTLTGWDSDIEMVDETPENRKQLTDDYIFQYKDVLLHQGQYYKPKYWFGQSKAREEYCLDNFGCGALNYENKCGYSGAEKASFYFIDVSQYHYTKHMHSGEFFSYTVVWEKVSRIPPLWFKDETDAEAIMMRRIMNNTFSNIIELTDDNATPRALYYVDKYSRQQTIPEIACQKLAPLAQEDVLDKLKEQVKKDALDAKERAFEIMRLRHEIWEKNGESPDDYVVLCDIYKVPRKPLEKWALCRSKAGHMAEKWQSLSGTGWKMYGDNPDHTDWVIGAGVDPADIYDDKKELNDAAYSWAFEFERSVTSGDFSVLVPMRASKIESLVQHPKPNDTVDQDVVVIPDCSTKWIKVAKQVGKRGGVIIAKTGGQMSHLVINGEDYGVTILLHPEADTVFPSKCLVEIDPKDQSYQFPQKSVQEIMTDAALRS